jgi:hypothetical protein
MKATNKIVCKGKYRNIYDNKELFDWLLETIGKKMEGEKLKALHHPIDAQMNETMNNAVARCCPIHKIFTGSKSLIYRVASVTGKHKQGTGIYMSNVYGKSGMTKSTLQQTFWNQWLKKQTNDAE